jgi:hypothetical protein
LTGGSATAFTSVSLASFVPPTSFSALLLIAYDNSAAGNVELRPPGSTVADTVNKTGPGIVLTSRQFQQRQMILSVSQAVEYKVANAGDVADIAVAGYVEEI